MARRSITPGAASSPSSFPPHRQQHLYYYTCCHCLLNYPPPPLLLLPCPIPCRCRMTPPLSPPTRLARPPRHHQQQHRRLPVAQQPMRPGPAISCLRERQKGQRQRLLSRHAPPRTCTHCTSPPTMEQIRLQSHTLIVRALPLRLYTHTHTSRCSPHPAE